jgi:hypothetical protein
VARRWQRCAANGTGCADIAGATASTYLLSNADIDHRVRLVETATNGSGSDGATVTSAVVVPVAVSISGPRYYRTGVVRRAGTYAVGTSVRGNTVWTVTAAGDVTGPRFGPGNGTLVGHHLNKPIVGIAATPSGRGYWLVAADGGVFGFGDARYYGSSAGKRLHAAVVELTPTRDGKGYWIVTGVGEVFGFGDAHSFGSAPANAHVTALLPSPTGNGYWLVTLDGRALRFGDATAVGRASGATNVVGIVATGSGYRMVTADLRLLALH